ncbi:hypothetical protein [Bacillus benzoevorans]|uniref:Uncharacterized protein n=1 Tax=Bacillus benzoevorans TaxID=1456 RepID=A0A7X0HUR1_9BACI|nr:hypothetical protein [Bacillus benzoevorans]MBB6447240.1 hypothetical protein [Bacillus benzoevorans]
MKKLQYIFIFTLILLLIDTNVSATSWVALEPEEVAARADVIVSGTYDFYSKPELSDFVFQGLDFYVNKVYKGDVSKKITAGIDGFDIGWAQEFQNQGGEFVLFLKKSEDFHFLIPVSGPNGMVQVQGGQVVDHNAERKAFFEDFLKIGQSITVSSVQSAHEQGNYPATFYFSSAGMLLIIAIFIMIYRSWRKRLLKKKD